MKKLNQTILLISITILFFACKKNDSVITGNTVPELILTDVAYASISTQQKMDVYLPADRSTATTYAVVMIHGGSWSGGDKSDFNTNIPNLRQLLGNYAIFNLNYRLANGSTILLLVLLPLLTHYKYLYLPYDRFLYSPISIQHYHNIYHLLS